MFSGRKKNLESKAVEAMEQVETIIGPGASIKGTISARSTVRIDGELDGDINAAADLIVGETGNVKNQINARNAVIAGTVAGKVDVQGKLELLPTAKVTADQTVGALVIAEGAVFIGNCTMRQSSE